MRLVAVTAVVRARPDTRRRWRSRASSPGSWRSWQSTCTRPKTCQLRRSFRRPSSGVRRARARSGRSGPSERRRARCCTRTAPPVPIRCCEHSRQLRARCRRAVRRLEDVGRRSWCRRVAASRVENRGIRRADRDRHPLQYEIRIATVDGQPRALLRPRHAPVRRLQDLAPTFRRTASGDAPRRRVEVVDRSRIAHQVRNVPVGGRARSRCDHVLPAVRRAEARRAFVPATSSLRVRRMDVIR